MKDQNDHLSIIIKQRKQKRSKKVKNDYNKNKMKYRIKN